MIGWCLDGLRPRQIDEASEVVKATSAEGELPEAEAERRVLRPLLPLLLPTPRLARE